jgi:2-phosphosulfolactate phosphatase
MVKKLEVIFAPAEYANLVARDLSGTTCVVFDILRATSTMLTAFANGAKDIIPVSEIDEALALRRRDFEILLAGERHGLRIENFDLGNSPREFTSTAVANRRIAITTTNGTRALRASSAAAEIYIGAFLNLSALATAVASSPHHHLLIICAGTGEKVSLEDTLAAGALLQQMTNGKSSMIDAQWTDSAQIALATYNSYAHDLFAAFSLAHNGRRLLNIAELKQDVALCMQRDIFDFTAKLHTDGAIRRS